MKTNQSVDSKHFNLVHQLSRRIRIIAPSLRKDQERSHVLQIMLIKRHGIEHVKTVPQIGSVTINFDPQQIPVSNLLQLLEAVIVNIGLKQRQSIRELKQKNIHSNQVLQDFVIGIGGMSCTSCALFLEMVLQREADITFATVNFVSETARVKGYLDKQQLFKIIENHGYQAFSIDSLTERRLVFELERKHLVASKKQLLVLGLLSLPVTILSLWGARSRTNLLMQGLLATPVVFWEGRGIFNKAIKQAKNGVTNMDSLIALGVGTTYGYSLVSIIRGTSHVYFNAATGIIDFVLLGRYLEEVAKNKVVNEIRKLVNLQPREATLIHNNEQTSISVDRIKEEDILLIRPGEVIPADGEVIKGLSNVDESGVTGSSTIIIKEPGQKVYDGSINGSGVLHVRVTAAGKDTVLSSLIHMVDEAQVSKLQIQKTVDAFSSVFVPSVIGLSGLTFFGWLMAGERLVHALSTASAVLLVSCPCALGLTTPAATMAGTGKAARRGIYVRNGEALEKAAAIDMVIFDKTGTITEGQAKVTDFFNISAIEDEAIIQLAASVEFYSEHILGHAIVRYAEENHIKLLEATHFHNMPDQGVRAQVNGHQLLLGSEPWIEQQGVDLSALKATAKKLSNQGKTLIFTAVDEQAVALYALSDHIRDNVAMVIEQLHKDQIETLLMTGDTAEVANSIAEQVGITNVLAEASPAKKLDTIRNLQQQGRLVAMVGDGVNDAPALAAADLSLAIDQGSDIAIHAADLILLNGDLAKVADSIHLSQQTVGIIKQNLFWAFSYNVLAIPFAMAGKLNPVMASAAMALSSLSVVANSLRLHKSSDGPES